MKINRILALTAGAVALLASCSDFEEINKNPKAASASDLKPYWALDKAIVSDQQNPNDAERVFVLYWGDIARLDGENSSRAVGRSNDEWAGCLYNLTRNCVTSTNNAIKIADDAIAGGELGERETGVFNNVKAASRIWRVYLMTEFVVSFGCFTTDFESTSPEYKSVEECYKFMLAELAESVAAIDVNFPASTDAEKKGDPAYQLDPAKWKNFGISMWMRLAMRLSEVEPATAKSAITWKSSSPKIAEVKDGVVTIHKAGTVTITATATKIKKSAKVKLVIKDQHAPRKITIDQGSREVWSVHQGRLHLSGHPYGGHGRQQDLRGQHRQPDLGLFLRRHPVQDRPARLRLLCAPLRLRQPYRDRLCQLPEA